MNRFALRLISSLSGLTLIALSGCASQTALQPAPDTASPSETIENTDRTTAPEADLADFEPAVLFQLLSAEIAAQRHRYDVALANYAQAARTSQDPGITRRALRIAQSLGADDLQEELAQLRLQQDATDAQARRVLAVQALKRRDIEGALAQMEALQQQGEDANFDQLAAMAGSLPAGEQQKLLTLYRQLAERHPEQPELFYSIALLQQHLGESADALNTLDELLVNAPNFQPALLLKGDVLYQSGKTRQALNFMTTQTRRYPGNRKLGELYGRMLLNEDELQAAQDEFQRLLADSPNDPTLRLSHGLVALENNQPELAREDLSFLLEQGQFVDQANYYLARLHEQAGETEQAVARYRAVSDGNFYFPALVRAIELMARDNRLPEARTLLSNQRESHPERAERLWLIELNLLLEHATSAQAFDVARTALNQYPDNVELRYSHAMLLDEQGDLDGAEASLRKILAQQPDNAVALNALGYTLLIRSDRLTEARTLIEKALALDPDNPAIQDSMGWVLFRQGELEQALTYLSKAWAAFPDPEVAAHYGEALWASGNEDQARMIWEQALEDAPDHELLIETIQRLTRPGAKD